MTRRRLMKFVIVAAGLCVVRIPKLQAVESPDLPNGFEELAESYPKFEACWSQFRAWFREHPGRRVMPWVEYDAIMDGTACSLVERLKVADILVKAGVVTTWDRTKDSIGGVYDHCAIQWPA